MKKITIHALAISSLGLMAVFSPAFARAETSNTSDSKAGYGPSVSSQQPEEKRETSASASANGSVEVEVKVKEYTIEMPLSVGAGATTFKVTNTGKETHGFEIEGNGIEKQIKPRLKEGASGSLRLDLKPGTYKVYCPVKGHKMLGMSLKLTVK